MYSQSALRRDEGVIWPAEHNAPLRRAASAGRCGRPPGVRPNKEARVRACVQDLIKFSEGMCMYYLGSVLWETIFKDQKLISQLLHCTVYKYILLFPSFLLDN